MSLKNETDKVLVYERAGLLFVFNFHPSISFTDYRVGVEEAGTYRILLSTDEKRFGGYDNIALDSQYFTTPLEWNGRKNYLQVFFVVLSLLIADALFIRSTSRPGPLLCFVKSEVMNDWTQRSYSWFAPILASPTNRA